MSRPDWLADVVAGAAHIKATDLTAFGVPEGSAPRRSAVLMLFGESERGPDILLTERAHTMRSHPGQVSFPGGSLDPGETPIEAALREADEEAGIPPQSVDVLGTLPELYLPPSHFAVTPVLGWWDDPREVEPASAEEVHAVYRVPISELADPAHRITVVSPRHGWKTPGFLIGPDKDVILWGFTGGVVARFLDFLGWIDDMPDAPEVDLPPYMLAGRERAQDRDVQEWSHE
ncbi:NUDIX hydrolase [Nocardioides sp.]|uniref:NUDIX hydrolase n=1 Tax=Nocardioides sp. TaxID=35761 RepID=UPI0039E2B5D6